MTDEEITRGIRAMLISGPPRPEKQSDLRDALIRKGLSGSQAQSFLVDLYDSKPGGCE